MRILELTLKAKEPLVITSGSAESMAHACLDYVPGSMLLGAFAAAWIRKNTKASPDQSPEFQSLFLNGEVSWGCAFPLCGDSPTTPVPLCYMREKSLGGLPVHGHAFNAAEFAIYNPIALDKSKGDSLGSLWKKRPGNADKNPKFKKLPATFMAPEAMRQPDLRKEWNIRVALGKQRSAIESQLFGFSALAAGSAFRSQIHCQSREAEEYLKALLADISHIRVGHARSAGYGLVEIGAAWKDIEPAELSGTDFYVFLLSHYLPDPPWEEPLANLLATLEEACGARPQVKKTFTAYSQIEGFNSHWKRPRDSRPGLAQGSAIKVHFPGGAGIPAQMALGAGQLEGYGRILLNPPFLASAEPQIPPYRKPKEKAANAPVQMDAPFWRILRMRALARAAQALALAWLGDERWQKFLKIAQDKSAPSASQRANLLLMRTDDFEKMLEKTPGRQWKEAVANDPFSKGRREHLHEIIRKLLDLNGFKKVFTLPEKLELPGGLATEEEKKVLADKSHVLFKRELIRTWSKNARIRQMEGQ